MIDLRKSILWKLIVFGSLYFSEGLMISLSTVLIPVYLIENGISLHLVGAVIAISSIPWATKFIWGSVVDYYSTFGKKVFILSGGFLAALSVLSLSIIPVSSLFLFTFVLFLARIGVVFLDVSSDAFSINVSKEEERGKINGAMFAGQSMGLTFGSFFLTYAAKHFGYSSSFILSGILILLAISISLLVKDLKKRKAFVSIPLILLSELRKKIVIFMVIFAPLISINAGILGIAIPGFMKNVLRLDVFQIGLISTVFSLASVFGALAGGDFSDRFGRRKSIFFFVLMNMIFAALLVFANDWLYLTILWAACGFFSGGVTSILCAIFMDITNPEIGATEFSVLTSVSNVGWVFGNWISGNLVNLFGFYLTFLIAAFTFLPSFLILKYVRLKH